MSKTNMANDYVYDQGLDGIYDGQLIRPRFWSVIINDLRDLKYPFYNEHDLIKVIQNGADVNICDGVGDNLLHALRTFRVIEDDGLGDNVSHYSEIETYIKKIIKILLIAGTDTNKVNLQGHNVFDAYKNFYKQVGWSGDAYNQWELTRIQY